jgi:hypothetical protein
VIIGLDLQGVGTGLRDLGFSTHPLHRRGATDNRRTRDITTPSGTGFILQGKPNAAYAKIALFKALKKAYVIDFIRFMFAKAQNISLLLSMV